jgi:hypothetical protein
MDKNDEVSNRVLRWIIMEKNYVANGVWRSATFLFSAYAGSGIYSQNINYSVPAYT